MRESAPGGNTISVADADAYGTETVALNVGAGTLNANLSGGATIGAGVNGNGSFTLSGSISQNGIPTSCSEGLSNRRQKAGLT